MNGVSSDGFDTRLTRYGIWAAEFLDGVVPTWIGGAAAIYSSNQPLRSQRRSHAGTRARVCMTPRGHSCETECGTRACMAPSLSDCSRSSCRCSRPFEWVRDHATFTETTGRGPRDTSEFSFGSARLIVIRKINTDSQRLVRGDAVVGGVGQCELGNIFEPRPFVEDIVCKEACRPTIV